MKKIGALIKGRARHRRGRRVQCPSRTPPRDAPLVAPGGHRPHRQRGGGRARRDLLVALAQQDEKKRAAHARVTAPIPSRIWRVPSPPADARRVRPVRRRLLQLDRRTAPSKEKAAVVRHRIGDPGWLSSIPTAPRRPRDPPARCCFLLTSAPMVEALSQRPARSKARSGRIAAEQFNAGGVGMARLLVRAGERRKIATFDSATAPHAKRMAAKTAAISIAILGVVRSEGTRTPRCYPLPPQGSASTNSATSAKDCPDGTLRRRRIEGSHVTNHGCRDKRLDA